MHPSPEERLHTQTQVGDRGVPCEVLGGVVERDGEALVRGNGSELCPPLSLEL